MPLPQYIRKHRRGLEKQALARVESSARKERTIVVAGIQSKTSAVPPARPEDPSPLRFGERWHERKEESYVVRIRALYPLEARLSFSPWENYGRLIGPVAEKWFRQNFRRSTQPVV